MRSCHENDPSSASCHGSRVCPSNVIQWAEPAFPSLVLTSFTTLWLLWEPILLTGPVQCQGCVSMGLNVFLRMLNFHCVLRALCCKARLWLLAGMRVGLERLEESWDEAAEPRNSSGWTW